MHTDTVKRIALINVGKLQEDSICEPIQLGYLAAFLQHRGISVTIIDEPAGDNIERELARFAPDYVGVTATTPLVTRAYKVLAYCKSKGYITIIGGPHVSALPEEAKRHADYVVVGEGENALYTILTAQPSYGIIQGMPVQNIDTIAFPDRSLMNIEFYVRQRFKEPVHNYYYLRGKRRMLSIITSRGCPFECIYCYNSGRGMPVRYRGVESVVNEIRELKSRYNIDALNFHDDDLFINKPRLMDLCKRLKQAQLNIIWDGSARVSSVDKEMLEAAYAAGCRQINYGIESGSQRVLDTLKKNTSVQQAKDAVRLAKETGMYVCGFFMIGTPGETPDDIKKTKQFIFSQPIDILSIIIATPYPGTTLWEYCKAHDLIPKAPHWDSFRLTQGSISANEFYNHRQLTKMRLLILTEIFFRLNGKLTFYYLKHPLYIVTKLVEALCLMIGFKTSKTEIAQLHHMNNESQQNGMKE